MRRPPRQRALAFVALLAFAVAASTCAAPASAATRPPFSASSPFNTPIPAGAQSDLRSPAMVARLVLAAEQRGFVLAVRSWTVPVYYASRRTPRRNVRLTAGWAPRRVMYGVRIPRNARPDPAGDGHMVVVDRARGCEYDFWQARKGPNGWTASWGNRIGLRSKGVFARGNAARASGFALQAGLIRPGELRARNIRHALVFSFPDTKAGHPVAPATQNEGDSGLLGAIPMGARVQLDPRLNLRSLGLTAWQRTIARALQRYGMFLADTSGGAIGLQAQNPQSFRRNPYRGVLPRGDSLQLPARLVRHMRVLKLPARHSAPLRVLPNRCARMR